MTSKLKKWFLSKDYFAITPELNFKKGNHFSFCGAVLSWLMYGFLLGFFIWQVVDMATSPTTKSDILYGQATKTIDFSVIKICQVSSWTFPDNLNISDYFGVGIMDQNNVLMQTFETEKCEAPISRKSMNQFCVCFPKSTTVPINGDSLTKLFIELKNKNASKKIQQNGSLDANDTFAYSILWPDFLYDPSNIRQPMKLSYQSLVGNPEKELDSLYMYYVDKIAYEIENGPLLSSVDKYETMTLSASQTLNINIKGSIRIQFYFTGQVVTNTRRFVSITDILAAVSGLQGTIIFIVTILFGKYFEAKYYEHMVKSINRNTKDKEKEKEDSKDIRILDLDIEGQQPIQSNSRRKEEKHIELYPASLNYFTYFTEKLKSIFKKKKSEKQNVSYIEMINKGRDNIENQLDVIKLLQRVKELEAVASEIGSLKHRIINLEASLYRNKQSTHLSPRMINNIDIKE